MVINVDQYKYICYLYCNTTSSAAPPTVKWFKCRSCAITILKFASGRMLQIKHPHRFYIFIFYCSTFHMLYRSLNSCLKDLKYCHELISGRCWKSRIFLLFGENYESFSIFGLICHELKEALDYFCKPASRDTVTMNIHVHCKIPLKT